MLEPGSVGRVFIVYSVVRCTAEQKILKEMWHKVLCTTHDGSEMATGLLEELGLALPLLLQLESPPNGLAPR